MIKWGYMVLKGVSWVHNDTIGSNGLERGQLGTQDNKNHGLGFKTEVFKELINNFIVLNSKTTQNLENCGLWWKMWFLRLKTTVFGSFKVRKVVLAVARSKTTVFGWKLWFLAVSRSEKWFLTVSRSKTVFFGSKLWFLAVSRSEKWFFGSFKVKNYGFLLKTTVFSWKPQFSVWFSIVGGPQSKTAVFVDSNALWVLWEELKPKTAVFSVVFSKNCSFVDSNALWVLWQELRPKTTVFSAVFSCKIRKKTDHEV